jgi:hypothetical protein
MSKVRGVSKTAVFLVSKAFIKPNATFFLTYFMTSEAEVKKGGEGDNNAWKWTSR